MLSHLSASEVEHLMRDIPTDQMMSYSPIITDGGHLDSDDGPPKKRCKSAEMEEVVGPSSSGLSREAQVLKAADQLASAYPNIDLDGLLARLNSAESVDVEADRIVAEFNDEQPGPSHSGGSPELPADIVEEATSLLNDDQRKILGHLCQMFPDADPQHILKLIAQTEEKNIDAITDQMFKNGYPRLRERKDKENKELRRAIFLSGEDFNPAEFLKIYPNPDEYFLSDQRDRSDLYGQHAYVFLCNQFRDMRPDFFKKLLIRHDNKLLPTYRDIMEAEERSKGPSNRRKKRKNFGFSQFVKERRMQALPYPEKVDEMFFREMQYCLNENVVKDYVRTKEEERTAKIEDARATGQLVECGICMDDEVLPDELVRCDRATDQHGFCRPCTKQHAETQIGNGAHFVRCMADDCDAGRLTLGALQTVLDGKALQLLVRRTQQDELRAANLANMDSCPFCDFAMIIENDLERLFRCLNPECLRESCRNCREPSHIPLRCEEVEQDEETKMRTFIENRMAEAMIRKCPKCKKPIIKSEGCNKMACPCGAYFCYYCNAELSHVNPYSHFSQSKCPQSTPIQQLHDDVAKKAGEEAKALFSQELSTTGRAGRPLKEVDIDTLVDNAAKTIVPPRVPAPPPTHAVATPIIPIIPPALAALRNEHAVVRDRLANLRWLVTTNQLVEDYDARRQLTVEIEYEIARCDGEPPTREVVDALVQSADALHNQWRRLLAEHRDGVIGRIADYRRYAAQLDEHDREFVLARLTEIDDIFRADNIDGRHEGAIATFNLLVPDIERMVNERLHRVDAEEQALKEVPVIELLDDDDLEPASAEAANRQQPMSNVDRQQMEKLKSSLTVFDRVLIDLNRRLEESRRDEQSRQRITNRLDKAIASRWQVLNRLEELETKATNSAVDPADLPPTDSNSNSDPASAAHAAKLQHVEVLRQQTAKLNAELQAAQQKLAKAPMNESRAALSEMKRLLNERDQSLKRVQEVEAALLRNGACEDDIVGRRDDDQLQLDEQEIQGAAEEAGRLAREATAKREAEQRMAIEQKPITQLVPTSTSTSTVSMPTNPLSFPFPPPPLPSAPSDVLGAFTPYRTTPFFPDPIWKPPVASLPYPPMLPSWPDYGNNTAPFQQYPTFPLTNNQTTPYDGYWNSIWRNSSWLPTPPAASPLNQAVVVARVAADSFLSRTPENIFHAVIGAAQTAQSFGMVFADHNQLVAVSNDFFNAQTAESGRRLFDLFFRFFADLCHAAGVEGSDKRAAVAPEWEQYMTRLEQEERQIAKRLRLAKSEVANLVTERRGLEARLERCDRLLREARARQTQLENDQRVAQARAQQGQPDASVPRGSTDVIVLEPLQDRKTNASPALAALLQQCVDDGLEKEVKQMLAKVGSRKRRSDTACPLLTLSSDESDDDDDGQSDIIYEATMRPQKLSTSSRFTSTSSMGQQRASSVDADDKTTVDQIIDRHLNKRKQEAAADDRDTPKEASNAATDGSDERLEGSSDDDDDDDGGGLAYFHSC